MLRASPAESEAIMGSAHPDDEEDRMGKNGELLRAKKAQAIITFTREQLEEHDKLVKKAWFDQCVKHLEKEKQEYEKKVQQQVEEEWASREKLFMTGDRAMDIAAVMQLMAYMAAEVLIEDFKWIVPKRQDPRSRILRFADRYAERISNIVLNEKMDIRETNRRFTKKYGIEFLQLEE